MLRYATEDYYQRKIAKLEAKIKELQNKLADHQYRMSDDGK